MLHLLASVLSRGKVVYINIFVFQQVVDVDHVRQRVTIKLVPRIDLQALAAKLVSIMYKRF